MKKPPKELTVYKSAKTCPIAAFWKIQETNDLRYLVILSKKNFISEKLPKVTEADYEQLEKASRKIKRSLPDIAFDAPGIAAKMRIEYLKLKIGLEREGSGEYCRLMNQLFELEKKQEKNNKKIKVDNEYNLTILESSLGFNINPLKTSVSKYYSYLKYHTEKAKQYEQINTQKNTRNGRK